MRIELLWFLALLVALVGANGKRHFNYESYPTFPGTPETWAKSQWELSAPQVNYYSSGLGANINRLAYNGYGHGQSWNDAGTGSDSILYNGGKWQGSGGYFGGYGTGLLGGGVRVTQKTSTGQKLLQGSGLRFGLDESAYSGINQARTSGGRALFVEGAPYNKLSRHGFSTVAGDVFGVYPGSKYGGSGSYGSYGRGTRWNAGSLFAPAGVKPMYGGISSIYGQNQIISGAAQLSEPILGGVSNLYSDSKWSNRGVYTGYGDGLDYYWKWRKNGFQQLDAAPVGVYGGYQTGSWNKFGGLLGSGAGSQYTIKGKIPFTNLQGSGAAFGNNAFFTKGSVADLGSGTSSVGLFNSANKFSGHLGAISGITDDAFNSGKSRFGSGLAAGSGTGSYIYSKFNTANAPLSTSNIFNVYGTKVTDLTVPAGGSSLLGSYGISKYQNRPYSSVGVYPMYTQSKWTADYSGKQTGYYNGYGSNSGTYYRPSSYRPGYTATLTGATPAFAQSGFAQLNSAKFPTTTGVIGTSSFSSNLYNDGKWSNRGVYSGYGDGLDYYWNWRKNGFKGAQGRPSGTYVGSTGSYSNVYDGSYASKIGNKYTSFGSTGVGKIGTGIFGSGSSFAIEPLLGSTITSGHVTGNIPSGTVFDNRRPAIGSASYSTGQYTQTSSKPFAAVGVFGLGSGFGSAGKFSGPSSAFGAVTTGAGQSSFGSGLATGSGAGTKLSGLIGPAVGSNLLGTYVAGKVQNRPYSTGGIYPMYTQSKWTTDNSGKQTGYYTGYGYNSGAYYRPTSYRPGYTATLTSTTPAFAQSGFKLFSSAKFPSPTGIIGSSGFSSNLYNDGKWSNRGTYSGYGDGLDWKWRKNGFYGASGHPGSTFSGSYDGSYAGNIGSKYTNIGTSGAGLVGTGISGSASSLAFVPLPGSSITSGYTTGNIPSGAYFGSSRPAASTVGYTTGQYTQQSLKPLAGASVFGVNANKVASFSSPSLTFAGLSKPVLTNLQGSGSYSATGSQFIAGATPSVPLSSSTLSGSIKPLFNANTFYGTAYTPPITITAFGVPAASSSSSGFLAAGNRYQHTGVTPMYSQSQWSLGDGHYSGYGKYSGSKYSTTSYRPGYVSTIAGLHPNYSGSKYTSVKNNLAQLTPASFPSTLGTIGSIGFSSNLYNNGKWSNGGSYYGYGNGLDAHWGQQKYGYQGASSALTGSSGGYKGSYNNNYSGLSQSLTGLASGRQPLSGPSGIALSGSNFASNTFPAKYTTANAPADVLYISQLNTAASPLAAGNVFTAGKAPVAVTTFDGSLVNSIKTANVLAPSIASLVNSGLLSGTSSATGATTLGAYIPSRYEKRPYSTLGITPMYSQSKWTVGGNAVGSGYYAGYGQSSGASYSPIKNKPYYAGSQYSGLYQGTTSLATFPGSLGSNLYGGVKWNNKGVYTGYAKNPNKFSNKIGGGFSSLSPFATSTSYKGNYLNNYNFNNAESNQGQYSASLNIPVSIGSTNNLNLAGSWSNRPLGFNSMYSANKWLINNGAQNTGVYYGYGSQGRYPSKVQTIYSGSAQIIPNKLAGGSTYQSAGNLAGLYNNEDWRNNGVYSGYGSGLDSYWRWRKSGFVGSGGKGSNAYTNSILGNLQGSAYNGQILQGGAGLAGLGTTQFGNSWSSGGSWTGSPTASTFKISQWSSPITWQGSGLSTNTFKLRTPGWK